jgi:apoptosis-inducing factor 2
MEHQPRILIVGGAYAGVSALNNLISLSAGKLPEAPRRGGPGGRGGRGGRGGQTGQAPPRPPTMDYASIITRPLRSKPTYTLLDERDGFYHSVGAPLGQISTVFAREFWISYEKIVSTRSTDDEIQFIQGTATALDMDSKTLYYESPSNKKYQSISYDYLILATGMRRGAPVVPQALDYNTYMADVERLETELGQCSKIVLVGGGKFFSSLISRWVLTYIRGGRHRNGCLCESSISSLQCHSDTFSRHPS